MGFYIFDLDGTLALIEHRRHFVAREPKDHRAFYAACDDDPPNLPVIGALKAHLAAGHRVEIWSARSDEVRDKTEVWLSSHGIDPAFLKRMRKAGDFTNDAVLKKSWLEALGTDRPMAIYDDRPSVVEMWRKSGIACFQVDPGEWDTPDRAIQKPGPGGNELILCVGPSGGGKSHYAAQAWPASWVVSTDEIRRDLCGHIVDQSRNDDVFEAVRRIAVARLSSGLSCVIDATHLRRKTRMAHAKLVPDGVLCRYIVIDRPLVEKTRDGGWRNGVMVEQSEDHVLTLIEKHDQHFQSELKNILAGDGLHHVVVTDLRQMFGAAA